MAYFALLLCTVFVLFLLWLDYKQSGGTTFFLWIPTVWMLVVSSKPLGVWFAGGSGTEEADMLAGSPLDRIFLLIILATGLIVLFRRNINWPFIFKENVGLIFLTVYMLISISWSEMSFVSLKRWTREFVAMVMFFLVITEPNPGQAVLAIFRRIIYILIPYSLVLINYFSHLGRIYTRWSGELMWIGVTTHKNSLTRLCAFTIFFTLWTLVRRRQKKYMPVAWYQIYCEMFILILALYLFAGPNRSLTYSATSFISLLFGLAIYFGLLFLKKWGKMPGARTVIVIVVLIILYGVVTPFLGELSIINPASALGRSETLTDRTTIWSTLVPLALKNLLFGHGFGGFWTDQTRSISASHAHNGYLDVILDLGLVGLFMIVFVLISYWKKGFKILAIDFHWGALFMCYILMVMIYNIAESSLISLASQMSAIFFFLGALFSSYIEKLASYSKLLTTDRNYRHLGQPKEPLHAPYFDSN